MKPRALVLTLCLLSGCATLPEGSQLSPEDPFERMNRATFSFNDAFDENLFQPVARAYVKVTPSFFRTGVGNFFGNINDVWTAFNSFLQGNVEDGLSDIMRVSVNSTFGLLGVLDFASQAGIPKHNSNFGQTLGVWGVPNGPYFVIPFLGPSVIRDTAALPLDYYGDLWTYYRPVSTRNMGTALRLVDKRAAYLDSYSLLEDAALDKYIFIRDAYLQRIASQIESRRDSKRTHRDAKENVTDVAAPAETSNETPNETSAETSAEAPDQK
jgi:phospholipid-binding lipoprotein MlaA